MNQEDRIIDMCFTENEIGILQKIGLKSPSAIEDNEKSNLLAKSKELLNSMGRRKGAHQTNGKEENVNLIDYIQDLLRIYIGILKKGDATSNGRYKLGAGGRFDTLRIQLPCLIRESRLRVLKNGVIVLDQNVDSDTVDILTKKFNSRRIIPIHQRI